jgi:hypothetical protein
MRIWWDRHAPHLLRLNATAEGVKINQSALWKWIE